MTSPYRKNESKKKKRNKNKNKQRQNQPSFHASQANVSFPTVSGKKTKSLLGEIPNSQHGNSTKSTTPSWEDINKISLSSLPSAPTKQVVQDFLAPKIEELRFPTETAVFVIQHPTTEAKEEWHNTEMTELPLNAPSDEVTEPNETTSPAQTEGLQRPPSVLNMNSSSIWNPFLT
mmetsp:Transcript_3526/g.6007  ORF Transcript_3526/g.6007 Transcript_3526/m.6007 type:complete len:175 (-) Transcript_3526:9-533(-)